MKTVNEELKEEVSNLVKEYFSDECEVELDQIGDDTKIIEDLDGDSLMYLSLLELVKSKYDIQVDVKTIGQQLLQQQVESIGQVVDMVTNFIESKGEVSNQAG